MTRLVACLFASVLSFSFVSQIQAQSSATQAVTSTSPTEVSQFQKIEDVWANAINLRDQYSLELVLSPLFVDVSAAGDITTRDQQIANLISTDDKTLHLEQKVITVRLLGDIAVANGTYVLHHRVNSSQVDEKGVFTHVYERVHGKWMCINSQRTLLRADEKTKGKKQSGAESSFHFPLFSHGDKKN